MKIGILTFHSSNNFGALLQAYALKEAVKRMGKDVEVLNYRQPYLVNQRKIVVIDTKSVLALLKSILFTISHLPKRIVNIKFARFRKKHLNLSKTIFNHATKIKGYDTYIAGSDQVWNTRITKGDLAYFLPFCSAQQGKIAYAASIGEDTVTDEHRAILKSNINNFNHISVREESAVEVLQEFTDKKIWHVLDPVLLLDHKAWSQLARSRTEKEKYLLIYRVFEDEEVYKVARIVAKKLNMQVRYINNYREDKYDFISERRVGPREFIGLFQHAAFVVTNSFHGTAFSIVFNKDFITVPPKGRRGRIDSLLQLLNLEHRLVSNCSEIRHDYAFAIDYRAANLLLEKEKEKSLLFLRQAIQGESL